MSPEEILEAIEALEREAAGREFTAEERQRWNELNETADEYRTREARILELARDPRNREAGADFSVPRATRRRDPAESPRARASRDEAERTIDRHADALSAVAGDRLVNLVERDTSGADAEYLSAIGDPAYLRAFSRILLDPATAHLRMSHEETEAVQRATRADELRQLTNADLATAGAFPAPFALDPSVLLTSDGSVNPLRELATVSTIATSEWRGFTSAGADAHFGQEASEVADSGVSLEQPVIKPERGSLYAEFSIEIGGDFTTLQQELAKLFADGRDQLEAEKFVAGTGTDEPQGLVSGVVADASSVFPTATTTLALGDVYRTQEEVPPRFQPRATWLSSQTVAHIVRRFTGPGSEEPPLFSADMATLLGKPWREVSNMSATAASGDHVLLYGDVGSAYRIVDRIGLSIELIQNVIDPTNNRPKGVRGVVGYFRVGSAVVNPNAVRLLKVASS